jgi:hypothetical protein
MFVRAKQSGPFKYLQTVENRRKGNYVVQRYAEVLNS